MDKQFLGVIVARGGSKGVPYKNITPLGGKPLLAWSYEAACQSIAISRIVCSTEDTKIAAVCNTLGLEVCPRPLELAQDNSPPYPVLEHTLNYLKEQEGYTPFGVFLIQPTSPFVLPSHFDLAAAKLAENPALAAVQSVIPVPHNFHAYNQRNWNNDIIEFAFKEQRMRFYNKQLKPNFYAWGNIFLTKTEELLRQKTVFPDPCAGFVVDAFSAMDVDYPEDFKQAEEMLKMFATKPRIST